MLVFEILECGLYHEKKRYICMSKCGRNVVKTRRYDSVLSPLFFLFFNLIKTAAKFMRNESVKCPAHAVFAKSRARHVHICILCHSIYLQVIKVHLFKIFDKPGLLCSLVSDYR